MLRAIGMSRRQVRTMIRYESVITALIGAILGIVLGILFATLIAQPLKDEGFTLSYPVGSLIAILVLAALVGVVAAILPARRAPASTCSSPSSTSSGVRWAACPAVRTPSASVASRRRCGSACSLLSPSSRSPPGVVYPLKEVAPAVSLGVVYIPGVLLIATVWGWRLGLLHGGAQRPRLQLLPPAAAGSARRRRRPRPRRPRRLRDRRRRRRHPGRAGAGARRRVRAPARARPTGRWPSWRRWRAERDRMQAEAIEAEALRRTDELKTSLLRSVSHDLRTPLTSIIAAGAALDSPSATAAGAPRAERGGGRRRAAALAPGREPARRLAPGNAATPSRTASRSTCPGCWRRRASSIGPRGELVRLALDHDLPALSADPAQLERAFANLLENAVVHGEGQPVLVRSRLVGPRLVVRVVDRGPGIPENERERIFEPFYRAGRRARQRLGPRPGDRPRLHRGQRRRGRGRVAARPGIELRRQLRRAGRRAGRGGVLSAAPRILVCDDEPQILRALRVILRDAGFEAVPAATGEEALDLRRGANRPRRRSST